MSSFRLERDTLGEVSVPADALFGAQTQRAVDNFPVSGWRFPRLFIAALAEVKGACAGVNAELGLLSPEISGLIRGACDEIARGLHDAHFPVDVFQSGSGTSTNMNINEVIANLSNRKAGGVPGVYRPVHPNDHVNMGQSSNDVVPTAIHVAALLALDRDLLPALAQLAASLEAKAREFDPVVKLGRTHLMDAVPVRMGQEFGGYAAQVRKAREHLQRESKGLEEIALGGTAVGTGLNAPPEFGRRVAAALERKLGRPLREAFNHFEAQAGRDDLVRVSGALRALACALTKIANDIRWMGSGPFGGLAELLLPPLQPGSSIMPGKVNPVMCEMLLQVAAQVIGNDAAVAVGGQGGHFELNAMMPLMANNLLSSIALLSAACRLFAARCVDGLQADAARCAEMLKKSPMDATALAPLVGYERAAGLVKAALDRKTSVRALAIEQGLVRPDEADRVFDYRRMTGPG